MTQEEADKIFSTPIGQQLLEFYCTPDGLSFLRYREAFIHMKDKGYSDEQSDKLITEWTPSWTIK